MSGFLAFDRHDDADIGPGHARAPRQGTRWLATITLKNFDATGIVARLQWRANADDLDPALALTEADGLTWQARGEGGTDAVLVIDAHADRTAALPAPANYVYDLLFAPGGDLTLTYSLFGGPVEFEASVTR